MSRKFKLNEDEKHCFFCHKDFKDGDIILSPNKDEWYCSEDCYIESCRGDIDSFKYEKGYAERR